MILSIELYEQMLEDIHDLAIVAERRSEPSISLAEMKQGLNSHEPLSNLGLTQNNQELKFLAQS